MSKMQPKKTMTAEMRRAAVLEAADAAAAKAKKTKLAAIREGPGSFAVVSVRGCLSRSVSTIPFI